MITFGILSHPSGLETLNIMLDSIESQNIPEYQVVIVGNIDIDRRNTIIIPFDETQTPDPWITKKKNLIMEYADHEFIVYAHDYMYFHEGWFDGWLQFGTDWDAGVNKVFTMEGYRHSDWLVLAYDLWEYLPETQGEWNVGLPYTMRGLNAVQYLSGNYFVAKRSFMRKFPLNESLTSPAQGEDVDWSKRAREATMFVLNTNSSVQLLKPNKWAPGLLKMEYLSKLAHIRNLQYYFI